MSAYIITMRTFKKDRISVNIKSIKKNTTMNTQTLRKPASATALEHSKKISRFLEKFSHSTVV